MQHRRLIIATSGTSALSRLLFFALINCLSVEAFWQNTGGKTVKEHQSKSVIRVMDEFVHGATKIPGLAFDQITHDYS